MSGRARLDALAAAHPEWAAWLQVVREVAGALADPAWDARPPLTAAPQDRRPWLAGAVLRPDAHAVARLLDRLVDLARAGGLHALCGPGDARAPTSVNEALGLFMAALDGDHARIDAQALRRGASPEGFRALVQWLPMPYLHACARAVQAAAQRPWSHGWCPVCGAWPALVEVRGVEAARHLRCGRCGSAWPMPALACTYCGTSDHERLGTLVPQDRGSRFAAEVCRACSGYLKSCTTLQSTPADELLACDLSSVEFDLVAVERGLRRPPQPAVPLGATLAGADRDGG